MTLVFKTSAGALTQTEVHASDIVATYSAAKSVYGWTGGLDGVRLMLKALQSPFERRIKELDLDQNLKLEPIMCKIITMNGPVLAETVDGKDSFGGDVRTQVIGSTLCALAHQLKPGLAVRLFVQCLAPRFFGERNPLLHGVQTQLADEFKLYQILNEGSARGLNEAFLKAINSLNLPQGNTRQMFQGYKWHRGRSDYFNDAHLVAGLLKWVTEGTYNNYKTCSGLVARVAVCLKEVGYLVGPIYVWDGSEAEPSEPGTKSLILTVGGSSSTDPLAYEDITIIGSGWPLHYQYETTGSMMLMALRSASSMTRPEVFQQHFETVSKYIEKHLDITYVAEKKNVTRELHSLDIVFNWRKPTESPSAIALRLATIYFPRAAEMVAPCYARIAIADELDQILEHFEDEFQHTGSCKPVEHFRVITAALVISITSRIAPHGFNEVHHSTLLDLETPTWLSKACPCIDRNGTLGYHWAIAIVAAVHAAYSPFYIENTTEELVAFRQGIFAVLPSLLLDMRPSADAPQLRCTNDFWANLQSRPDGTIRSASSPPWIAPEAGVQSWRSSNFNPTGLGGLNDPWLGPATSSTADYPMYLHISTPLHYPAPDLCFVGRVNGAILGAIGVMDILVTLMRSRDQPTVCPGHEKAIQVINVNASSWASEDQEKRLGGSHHLHVAVSNDDLWTLFLAGQTVYCHGRIVFRCAECAAATVEKPGVLIGYWTRSQFPAIAST